MKLAVVVIARAAATTISSAAPSHDFSARAPEPAFINSRGCHRWWQVCGLKAKRDTSPSNVTQESIAAQYSQAVKSLNNAKELSESGEGDKAMDSTGYTHEVFLFDFYGGNKAPATAKHTTDSKPGCAELALCGI